MKKDPKPMLKKAFQIIKDGNSETPVLDAELLFIKAMKDAGESVNRTRVAAGLELEIREGIEEKLIEFAKLRASGKPIQYIIGEQEFMGIDFQITEGILIPRADTETLVEAVLELYKERTETWNFLDLCTGTGAIGISILHHDKNSRGVLVDISDIAYKLSRENAFKNGVDSRCVILKGDLFEPLFGKMEFDLIVSNPPYIKSEDIDELMSGVKDFEPHLALDGGIDGLKFYRKIAEKAKEYLKVDGILAFEIGYDQGDKVEKIMINNGYKKIRIIKDLAGHDRCIMGQINDTTGLL